MAKGYKMIYLPLIGIHAYCLIVPCQPNQSVTTAAYFCHTFYIAQKYETLNWFKIETDFLANQRWGGD